MAKRSLTLEIDSDEMKVLEQRAKQNFMSPRELAQDIIRRSMLSYRGGKAKQGIAADDMFVNVFSREKRGRRKLSKAL